MQGSGKLLCIFNIITIREGCNALEEWADFVYSFIPYDMNEQVEKYKKQFAADETYTQDEVQGSAYMFFIGF